jgi:hypothetical protein
MDRSTPEILTSSRGQDSLARAVSMVDAATIILRGPPPDPDEEHACDHDQRLGV